MGVLRQFGEYLFIKKKDPNAPRTSSMKFMHGVNRTSILVFILCMVILAVKLLKKH